MNHMNRKESRKATLFDKGLVKTALIQSFAMLNPRTMARNPVMFVTEIGAALTTLVWIIDICGGHANILYTTLVTAVLWLTVLFANFAEALAEARGKAQADSLKNTRRQTMANRLGGSGRIEAVSSSLLKTGDIVVVSAGEIIPSDGEVIEGVASIDESAITGESAPVVREAGGDRSGVTGGTRVLSDRIKVKITAGAGESFLDRMIALVEGAVRQKTPNELALTVTLAGLTLGFLLVTATLYPMAKYFDVTIPLPTLISLLVCLIPTTIGALLAAIGIAGMDRALAANVLAKSGKAVELAGDIDTLLLDKTGTITVGDRLASIITLAERELNGKVAKDDGSCDVIEFTAQTRMSGTDATDGTHYRKGASDAVIQAAKKAKTKVPADIEEMVTKVARKGCTPIVVSVNDRILGVVALSDILKTGIRDRFERLRAMGLRVVMVTGDNPLTAKAIAEEAGVDDFIAEAKPEDKLAYIRQEQARGRLVAMMGDGTNDAPALAQADIGIAMNSGTQAAKEAGNMVDLDSDPTKLIEVIEIGKQLLMTRGALTTFSIANDVAKYFAIIPAIFLLAIPELAVLNIMHLATPSSAILSALIFNAVIIPLLIPIALKGVKYRPMGADALLARNLFIYGLGGVIAPFIGIKLIDMVLAATGLF